MSDRLEQSLAFQLRGEELFAEKKFEEALEHFYKSMMIRVELGRDDLADLSRKSLDLAIEQLVPALDERTIHDITKNLELPSFLHHVLNRNHASGPLPVARSNCMNAALNFFASEPYEFETASTLAFLETLKKEFEQIDAAVHPRLGDLLVFWSRSGGTWDERRIQVAAMKTQDSDFPYGLVFEHVAVALTPDVIFHKPSPALEVPYKIDHLEAARAGLKYARGFEMTLHRRKI